MQGLLSCTLRLLHAFLVASSLLFTTTTSDFLTILCDVTNESVKYDWAHLRYVFRVLTNGGRWDSPLWWAATQRQQRHCKNVAV